jgi:hypothetical protein
MPIGKVGNGTAISLVFGNDQGAVLGRDSVRSRYPEFALQNILFDFPMGRLVQLFCYRISFCVQEFLKGLGNHFPRQVDVRQEGVPSCG